MVAESKRLTNQSGILYTKEKPKGEPEKCPTCRHTVAFRQGDILYVICRACGKQVKFRIMSV